MPFQKGHKGYYFGGSKPHVPNKAPDEMSPKEKIDAEPPKRARRRFVQGQQAWFIDTGPAWFLVEIVKTEDRYITIKPVTGKDDSRQHDWSYGTELRFRSQGALYERLRKLDAYKR